MHTRAGYDGFVHIILPDRGTDDGMAFAVSSWDAAVQYRKGAGTETTHWRVGTQGMTRSTRWAAVWAMRRPAHDGQNPRRLQLKARSTSCLQVSQPSRSRYGSGRGCVSTHPTSTSR